MIEYTIDVDGSEYYATAWNESGDMVVYMQEVDLDYAGCNQAKVFVSYDEGITFKECDDLPEWWGSFDQWCIEHHLANELDKHNASFEW